MAETSVLDPDRIAMLRELDDGDGTLLPTIVDQYERDAAAQVAAMRAALDAADASAPAARRPHAEGGERHAWRVHRRRALPGPRAGRP